MTTAIFVHSRWMIRRDLPEVLDMDREWDEETYLEFLRERNKLGYVAEAGGRVMAFMLYEIHKSHIFLTRLLVHPEFRRQQVGRQLLDKLKTKLDAHRRNKIVTIAPEGKTDCHLFLKSQRFKAIKVLPNYFDGQDGYRFLYQREEV